MALLIASVLRPLTAGRRGWLGLLACLLAGTVIAGAQPAPVKEYQVKAAFLFNFAQFVDWPETAFPQGDTPLTIGVLGEDPFGGALDEIVRGEQVHGRTLRIQHYRRVEDAAGCHVLFISRSESARLEQIVGSLRGRSILTVGDSENFVRRGGMIGLLNERNKIHLRINRDLAAGAGLTISSKLLRVAEIVNPAKD